MMPPDPRQAPELRRVLVAASPVLEAFLAGQSLDRALQHAGGAAVPADAVRGAVRDVATCAVRHLAQSRFLLDRLARRTVDAPVEALLLLGIGLLLARKYADFTVVDQTVEAARDLPRTAAAGAFVNAVLRNFLRQRKALEDEARQDPARAHQLPSWWWRRLCGDLGDVVATSVARTQLLPPPLILRVNPARIDVDAYVRACVADGQMAERAGPQAVRLLEPVPVTRIRGFAEGLVSVQDAGAQLAARVLGAEAGMRVLDACAAPGGKTAHLAELSACRIDAIDRDASRIGRIDENLQRLGGTPGPAGTWTLGGAQIAVRVADAARPSDWWDGLAYDRILLDAPCTASGIVRRHPDVVWLRRPEDVANLATRQAALLRALWPLLAPAGRFLYVVCSVFATEGRDCVRAFLDDTVDARLVPLPADAGGGELPECPGLPGSWRLLPDAGDASVAGADSRTRLTDGFFYALLEKIGP